MTITEAERLIRDFNKTNNPDERQRFSYIEALEFLIDKNPDPRYMMELGGYYYEQRKFDLALKYYEMADEYDYLPASICLGYVWYYGRTGECDYKKAFYYYDKARRAGDLVSAYKVADMYRNGYYVDKDPDRYKAIIEELYPKVKGCRDPYEPLPEVFTRLAKIRSGEGRTEEALRLYGRAREVLARRISLNPFFGNLNIMKWMIADIYALREFDPVNMDIYDLYYVLRRPAKVSFTCDFRTHEVESVEEDGGIVIRFDDKWFRNVDDFFAKATVDGTRITDRYNEIYDFEVQ